MTEAELIEIVQGAIEIGNSQQEFALTVLTGYLLIAYFVGTRLTRFEVSFITSIYILMGVSYIFTRAINASIVQNYREMLLARVPEYSSQIGFDGAYGIPKESYPLGDAEFHRPVSQEPHNAQEAFTKRGASGLPVAYSTQYGLQK